MALIHSLLAASYQPLRTYYGLLRFAGIKRKDRIRVLIYHDIAPHEEEKFASQLRWLARSWTFVSPQRFEAMMSGDEPVKGANLLLSFDDAFASNLKVAKEILSPMGIKALFFVPTAFAEFCAGDDLSDFITHHIWPGLPAESVPEYWRNMTWADLSWLIEAGHTIGAHTRTHARLSDFNEPKELEAEIVDSANELERNLGVKVEHFAYPFGNLSSLSPRAVATARQRFRFVYTGLRGDNSAGVPSWCLRRDAMAPSNSFGLVGSLLEGGADPRYARDLAECESWR